jgi:cystathionine beta-lyase
MSHASIPEKIRKERALPEDLIRLCVGIEDVRDLIEDLEQALVKAGVPVVSGSKNNRASLDTLVDDLPLELV